MMSRAWKFLTVLPLVFALSADARAKKASVSQIIERKIAESTTPAPVDNEVCFAPKEPCDIKLVKFVETATATIDVAAFDINLDQLVHTMLVKSKKGVKLRVILDKRQAAGKYSLSSTLIKAGASVKYGKQRGLMHNKFIIVDGKRIETGSFNFTNHASTSNNENQIYLSNPQIVARFSAYFEEMWREGRESKAK